MLDRPIAPVAGEHRETGHRPVTVTLAALGSQWQEARGEFPKLARLFARNPDAPDRVRVP